MPVTKSAAPGHKYVLSILGGGACASCCTAFAALCRRSAAKLAVLIPRIASDVARTRTSLMSHSFVVGDRRRRLYPAAESWTIKKLQGLSHSLQCGRVPKIPTSMRAKYAKTFVALAGAAALIGALTFRPLRLPGDRRPNVLLVSVDTLRADHLGSYGYGAAQTPALDALARRGLRFAQAATVAPLTLPAHSSLMTGTFPAYHGVRDNGGFYLGDDQVTLAKVLRARGYRTGGFVAAFVLDGRWGIGQGFDRYYDDFDLAKYRLDVGLDAVQRPGSEVVSKAIEWLDQDSKQPFLAWVHLYEPHAPYDPPESIRVRFPPTMIGAYDAEIATADIQIGRLIDHLATAGRLDRTIVVALGDHGESLGEH